MTVRASKSNAPMHKRERKHEEAVVRLREKYIAEGLSAEEADERARRELRDE